MAESCPDGGKIRFDAMLALVLTNLCVGGEDGKDPVDDGQFRLDRVDRLLLY